MSVVFIPARRPESATWAMIRQNNRGPEVCLGGTSCVRGLTIMVEEAPFDLLSLAAEARRPCG
jgi:hypothetical protein